MADGFAANLSREGWVSDSSGTWAGCMTCFEYMSGPIHRSYHHNHITFSMLYAFSENFVLPFSHDEVVHGKGSMIGKVQGDEWQKFANLRALYGYMFGHPGKKLLFMGDELGQWREWNHDTSLDWHLLALSTFIRAATLGSRPEYVSIAASRHCTRWTPIPLGSSGSTARMSMPVSSVSCEGQSPQQKIAVVCNFTPVPRLQYRVGVPQGGYWKEMLNSDSSVYGGSGLGNLGGADTWRRMSQPHGRFTPSPSTLPPLAVLFFKPAS